MFSSSPAALLCVLESLNSVMAQKLILTNKKMIKQTRSPLLPSVSQKWWLCPTTWHLNRAAVPASLIMTNKCTIKRTEFLGSPEARGGSGWAAVYIKDEILKLALAALGFVLIFKSLDFFFTGSTKHKQIKLRRWDKYSEIQNSPATSPHGTTLINTKCLIFLFLLLTVVPGILICCFVFFVWLCAVRATLIYKPTSQVRPCFGRVSAARWRCCLSGSERSPGRTPAWRELRTKRKAFITLHRIVNTHK